MVEGSKRKVRVWPGGGAASRVWLQRRAPPLSLPPQFELTSNENVYCIELDAQKRVYVAVITRLYPKRHIFSSSSGSKDPRLMTEFRAYVDSQLRGESAAAPERGLRKALRPFLKQLASRFDDIEGIDRVAAAQAKVRSAAQLRVRAARRLNPPPTAAPALSPRRSARCRRASRPP